MISRITHYAWVFLIFLFIYGPPFNSFPLNISTVLFFPLLCLFVSKRKFEALSLFKIFSVEIYILCLILSYVLVVSVLGDFGFGWMYLILVLLNFPTACFIVALNAWRSFDGFSRLLIDISFLAGVVSIYLFFFPELNHWVKFTLLKYDEGMMQFQLFRGFGMADELLFSYSIAQAFGFYLCLMTPLSWLRKIVYLCVIFTSIVFNAKIGILFCLLALLLYYKSGNIPNKVKIYFSIFMLGVVISGLTYFEDEEYLFLVQLMHFYNEVTVGGGSNDGELAVVTLFSEMFFLPEGFFGLIFGRGVNIFASTRLGSSDSGWVLLLHFGGFILIFLVLLLPIFIFARLVKYRRISLAIFILLVFAIANVKGLFFAPKPGMRMMLLLYIFAVHDFVRSRATPAWGLQNAAGGRKSCMMMSSS